MKNTVRLFLQSFVSSLLLCNNYSNFVSKSAKKALVLHLFRMQNIFTKIPNTFYLYKRFCTQITAEKNDINLSEEEII